MASLSLASFAGLSSVSSQPLSSPSLFSASISSCGPLHRSTFCPATPGAKSCDLFSFRISTSASLPRQSARSAAVAGVDSSLADPAEPTTLLTPSDVDNLREELEGASPLEIMDKALALFGQDAAIAFSGAEDVALVELAHLTGRPFRVFCLDTGRLNAETYRFLDKVREHYGVAIEVMFPDAAAVQQLVQAKGLFSFYTDGHKECCSIRKVEPLKRTLKGLRAWITGQRRDQSADTRGSLQVVELDSAFAGLDGPVSLVKFNPLACVSGRTVWSLLDAQGVPVNDLHAKGYLSIGCEPCTRPVLPHQQEREGRWWWESSASKECGLHNGATAAASSTTTTTAASSSAASVMQGDSASVVEASPGSGAPVAALPREQQEWPDLYVSPHVTVFTQETITDLLEGKSTSGEAGPDSWLLVVYAPWCPFCQALEPALLQAAEALAGAAEGRTRVAKFRGDRDQRDYASKKLGVKSFPSIYMLRPQGPQGNGTVVARQGQSAQLVKRVSERRDAGALLRWVEALQ